MGTVTGRTRRAGNVADLDMLGAGRAWKDGDLLMVLGLGEVAEEGDERLEEDKLNSLVLVGVEGAFSGMPVGVEKFGHFRAWKPCLGVMEAFENWEVDWEIML